MKFRSTQGEVCLEEKRIRRRMENAPGEERFSINLHERPCFIRFQLLQTVGEVLDKSEEQISFYDCGSRLPFLNFRSGVSPLSSLIFISEYSFVNVVSLSYIFYLIVLNDVIDLKQIH